MKMIIICILSLLNLCLSNNLHNTKRLLQKKSSLNHSDKLGLFRDLTKNEIISYYKTTDYRKGLKKEDLIIFLQNIISNNHKRIEYKDAWKNNWQFFTLLDRDWDYDPLTQEEIDNTNAKSIGWKTNNVSCLPLYTDRLIFINGSVTLVDREHIWPISKGFKIKDIYDTNKNPHPYGGTDMHNLHMGDKHNNENGHNNLPFGNVLDKSSAKKITSSTTGKVTGYVGLNKYGINVYEPRDIDKGHIARTLFYMATRYHTFKSIYSYEPAIMLVTNFIDDKEAVRTVPVDETRYNPATYGILEDLLEWNKMEPVNEHEIHRNNLCHNIVQGNRNPYIDYPEWADAAFGNSNIGIDLSNDNGLEKMVDVEQNRIKEENMIPVSEIFNSSYSTNYLYCSESLKDEIHIFFEINYNNYHYIYDREEENIKEDEAEKTSIVKLDYFNTNKEYIMLYKSFILSYSYYINEAEAIKLNFGTSDNFIIFENNNFIITDKGASLRKLKFYLKFTYYPYPPNKENSISFSFEDLYISRYEMVETSEAIVFFIILDEGAISKPLEVYAFDKKELNFEKIKTLSNDVYGLTLISLNDISDDFIYCTSKMLDEPKCFPASFSKKQLTSGTSIDIFDWTVKLPHDFSIIKNYALLSNQRIAIIHIESNKVYLTIFEYKDGKLILGDIKNVKILEYPSYFTPSNSFLTYYFNKGLVLYNILTDTNDKKVALYKSYFEESCSSFSLTTNVNAKTKIFFSDYIIVKSLDSRKDFMITEIPFSKIVVYCDDKEIKPGNTIYNNLNKFHFIASYSDEPIIIKFKSPKSSYTCSANINIFHYLIEVKEKSYQCNVSPKIEVVNNITYTDLNKTFDINTKQNIYFSAEFNNPVSGEELNFRYSNINFGCKTYLLDIRGIKCKIPIDFDLFPPDTIKYDYDIYSKLSCLNDIYIGSIIGKDPYVIEVFEADNLEEISQNIDKKYDASQKIDQFSVDMINYYYWFTCFGYCDDDYIESGECCKEQILDEWEILSHKEYIWTFSDYIQMLDLPKLVFENMKGKFIKSLEDDLEEVQYLTDTQIDKDLSVKRRIKQGGRFDFDIEELFKVYFYNFSILKSKKYKKYIFAFPGTTTNLLLLSEVYLSEQIEFENDADIKVHKLFYYIFEEIKNDIFSRSILNEIKVNKDYQIIFTGHSLGGAISTIASYYYAKFNLAENDPVLITFGQPRVGNENFARDYMKLISKVFRIERYQDLVAMVPPRKKIEDWESVKKIKLVIKIISYIIDILAEIVTHLPAKATATLVIKKILDIADKVDMFFKSEIFEKIKNFIEDKLLRFYPSGYCHIGGLYTLNEESNKFYHCKDIYNQDIKSPYCKNWGIKLGTVLDIPKYLENHHYLTMDQRPMERCQESKNIRMFR